MALTAGSYHTNLLNAIAKLYNQLCAADAQSTLLTLPEFQFADSGKTFSLVISEHICTFSGLVKEEVNNFQVNIPFSQVISQGDIDGNNTVTECAILFSCKFIFHELNINPKLLELLQVSTQLQSTSDDSHPHSLCLMDVVLAITKQKAEEMPHDSGVHAAIKSKHCVGTLEHYFKYSAPCSHGHPPESRKVKATSPTLVAQSSSQPDTASGLTAQNIPAPASFIPFIPTQPLINNPCKSLILSSSVNTSSVDMDALPILDAPGNQDHAGQKIRSQHLFLVTTSINPESLMIKGNNEFFLFMEMCKKFCWVSYEMTSNKLVEATEEYNHQLVQKVGTVVIRKNPLTLLHKLGEMEVKLID